MPNIKSKEKRLKQNKKIRINNKGFKSQMNTAIKKANESKKPEDINNAISLIDSSVSKGILKKNNASRKKSKLHALNK